MRSQSAPDESHPHTVVGVDLRPARPDEQSLIRALVRSEHLNPLNLNWRHFWMAEAGQGKVIACGQVKAHGDGSRELASLVVLPAWRGKGVAAALIARLKAEGGQPLWLTCRSGLVPFYTRFGFLEVKDGESLPPYFRRLRRLAGLFLRVVRPEQGMAVMVWSEGSSAS